MPTDADVLYEGEWLTIRAMRRRNGSLPAMEWLDGLDRKGKGQFYAAAHVAETTLRANRPPAGRIEKVRRSRMGLQELRVTLKGGKPPHLRLLFVRRGQTLWASHGFTKKKNDLAAKEISLADSITREWGER